MSCRVSEMLIFLIFEKNFKKCFATALKQTQKKTTFNMEQNENDNIWCKQIG